MLGVEMLKGDNQYFCETCEAKVDATRGMMLGHVPPILTLALNRFSFDWATGQRKKITSNFQFPLELCMNPYVDNRTESLDYELFAVIIHRGSAH
jgi:ubiquitin C-terminal hydrolase